jgi:hypothetical protein
MMKQRVIAMLPRMFAIVAVVVILGAALGAGSALAAKGGNGSGKGNGGNGDKTVATMTVSPDPVPLGTAVTITGSGFKPGPVVVAVDWNYPYDTVMADSAGSFTYVYSRPLDPGFHGVLAYQQGKGKKGMELKAYTSFTVEP